MKLTEKQKMILFQTLMETLKINDSANCFLYSRQDRADLANEIIDQQDNEGIINHDPYIAPINWIPSKSDE